MNRHVILPLDPAVIGKIAAGEVVERPALAIKELIENSIDAGATSVTIQIRNGGLSYFRVTDNGAGIDPADIKMAFSRHATSKIKSELDLYSIYTLGFRGEALHSIAAVSKVEMVTRRAGLSFGMKAVVEGGVFQSVMDAPSPEGTSVVVRDLFFNTPARKKFLKKPVTEAGLVSELVMRLIIARPDISFRLQNEEKKVVHSPGNGKLRDALLAVWGGETQSRAIEVIGNAAGCAVQGFVGVGELAKSNRSMQTFILNGRFVRNAVLSKALEEGCRDGLMAGKHPICALHLTMPFEAVDVNVHPNKLEVRFSDERALCAGLADMIHGALKADPMQSPPVLSIVRDDEEKKRIAVEAKQARISSENVPALMETGRPAAKFSDSAIAAYYSGDAADDPMEQPPAPDSTAPERRPDQQKLQDAHAPQIECTRQPEFAWQMEIEGQAPPTIVGSAWRSYIIAEMGETLYFIDQHAAHERILYERMKKALNESAASQILLAPEIIQLTYREHAAVFSSMEDLSACGFEIEDFGDRSVQVRAVPMILGLAQTKDYFIELAERMPEVRPATAEQKRETLIQMACKKAVKAGDSLPMESIEALIRQMRETGTSPTCPHGRPLVIRIEKADVDKRFRRV